MTDKKGSGEKIGSIEISDNAKWIISDDGDPDYFVRVEEIVNGAVEHEFSFKSRVRMKLGDEEFIEKLENLEGDNYQSII